MKRLRNLTQEQVRRLFTYNPETGTLTWNYRDDVGKSWNNRFAGKVAGSVDSHTGYRRVAVHQVHYQAHQVIWLYVHGYWANEVDHQDHDRDNNRLVNLFDVDRLANARNHTLQSNNTSGHVGVSQIKGSGNWRAYIYVGKKYHQIGVFKDMEAAIAARLQAANDLGFHPNHGEAA